MKPEMLQIQQYLNVHPINKKDATLRKKYISLLTHFVKNQGRGDLWSRQCLALYTDAIVGTGEEIDGDRESHKHVIASVQSLYHGSALKIVLLYPAYK